MKKNINDYMAAVIDRNGQVDYLGYQFNYPFHAACLKAFLLEKYSAVEEVDNMDYMEKPFAPMYILTEMNSIIFANVSTDNKKSGIIYFPKHMYRKQIIPLYHLIERANDFEILICRLKRDEDMIIGDVITDDVQGFQSQLRKLIYSKKMVKERRGNNVR